MKTYQRQFIYNKPTGTCLSTSFYNGGISIGAERLNRDFKAIKNMMPNVAIGEATFDKATKMLIEQTPPGVRGVKYKREAMAEHVLRD